MNILKSVTANKELKALADGNFTLNLATGKYISIGTKKIYFFTTAITANSTATTATAGDFAITSNATGMNSIFRSDGTKWQALA